MVEPAPSFEYGPLVEWIKTLRYERRGSGFESQAGFQGLHRLVVQGTRAQPSEGWDSSSILDESTMMPNSRRFSQGFAG